MKRQNTRSASSIRSIVAATALGFALPLLFGSASAAPAPVRSGPGGGEYVFQENDSLTDEQRREIWAEVDRNVRGLKLAGKLPPRVEAHPLLQWPLRAANGLTDPGLHGISNFVDQNPAFPNQILDYNCRERTYDNGSGYNHGGTDMFLWPFSWLKMDTSQVEVIAAAPGVIIYRSDGNFDRSCSFNNNNWNAVFVQHADGSVAWYGHLKNGSVTVKNVGDSVALGEYLGTVGSSGNSTGPHLHFEVYDSTGVLNDPYQGPCNSKNLDSWWAAQRPYYDSALNHLATMTAPPIFPGCGVDEIPNERNAFTPGSTVYVGAYYRDQLSGQSSRYRIYRPDGSVFDEWFHEITPVPFYASSYFYWSYTNFAPAGPEGIWKLEIQYQGQTYTHDFEITTAGQCGRVPETVGMPEPPLIVSRVNPTRVRLEWGASCFASDTDYSIYGGTMGSFDVYDQIVCSTGGVRSRLLFTGPGSYFYLVVPTNGLDEGSYGLRTPHVERPPSASACHPASPGMCP